MSEAAVVKARYRVGDFVRYPQILKIGSDRRDIQPFFAEMYFTGTVVGIENGKAYVVETSEGKRKRFFKEELREPIDRSKLNRRTGSSI